MFHPPTQHSNDQQVLNSMLRTVQAKESQVSA